MFVALDVDRTLLKKNISFLFGKELFRQKQISFFQGMLAGLVWLCFYVGLFSQETVHRFLFSLIFRGKEKRKIQKLFHIFFSQQKEHLVRHALLATIQSCKDVSIALFSSSPDFIVEEIGSVLHIPEAYGSCYCVDKENCFSSLGTIMTGMNKAAVVQQRRRPIAVYTDSAEDIPLLEIADIPVVVSPDHRLLAYAQKKGWKIVF